MAAARRRRRPSAPCGRLARTKANGRLRCTESRDIRVYDGCILAPPGDARAGRRRPLRADNRWPRRLRQAVVSTEALAPLKRRPSPGAVAVADGVSACGTCIAVPAAGRRSQPRTWLGGIVIEGFAEGVNLADVVFVKGGQQVFQSSRRRSPGSADCRPGRPYSPAPPQGRGANYPRR